MDNFIPFTKAFLTLNVLFIFSLWSGQKFDHISRNLDFFEVFFKTSNIPFFIFFVKLQRCYSDKDFYHVLFYLEVIFIVKYLLFYGKSQANMKKKEGKSRKMF